MRTVIFSTLYLLSSREKRALKVSFAPGMNLLVGGNQAGKSVVIKSLYEALGAKPHKVDDTWRSEKAYVLLQFTIDGEPFAALKVGSVYAVFDKSDRKLIQATSLTTELGPFLADLLEFRLVMLDKSDKTVTPPPSYIFAPFYVDQDKSWSDPWKSFSDLYLPNTPKTLSEYFSGIRPNEYYEAQVERDQLRSEMRETALQREALASALSELRGLAEGAAISYDLAEFAEETDRLVTQANLLAAREQSHRSRIASLNEELQLWQENLNLLKAATSEMDASLAAALTLPHDVECPTCGHVYRNSIVEQFGLVSEKDGIIQSMLISNEHIASISSAMNKARAELDEVTSAIEGTNAILNAQRSGLSFREIVAAEGRVEASGFLADKVSDIDKRVGEIVQRIAFLEKAMKDASDTRHAMEIRASFYDRLERYLLSLDVSLQSTRSRNIYSIKLARGSEGPRGLAGYYYAFLHLIYQYGGSVSCPMVIDGPNQQGQDKNHMPQILEFLIGERPAKSQCIVAVEESYDVDTSSAEVIDIGNAKRRVLRDEDYAIVNEVFSPYLAQLTQ